MRLVLVSNRVAPPDNSTSAGGLVVALREALQAQGGLWFGWSGGVAEAPDPTPRLLKKGRATYALMDISATDRDEYYLGYANRALWPNMHYRLGLTQFSRADYAGYLRVNRWFAEALQPLLKPDDVVWVHDYHLIPFAAELRRLGAANRIGYFHHIPWPPPEVFGALPASGDLLQAMAAYDLVGLHTRRDVSNLIRALVSEVADAEETEDGVRIAERRVMIRPFPVGIDAAGFRAAAEHGHDLPMVRRTMRSLGVRQLVIGVDRLDYSKGLVERLEAFERFVLSNPDRRGRVVMLQIAPPSRTDVPEYEQLNRQLDETVGRINGGLSEPDWSPIVLVKKAYARAALAGLYRHAVVGLVTPMRDGMNLVAKEYVAAQRPEDPGVLVLSRFAGAAAQMREALIVNPYDKFEVAEALSEAFFMPRQERIRRWERLIAGIETEDIGWWTNSFLAALAPDLAAPKPRLQNPKTRRARTGRTATADEAV